jgi:glycosyltransferase involved in cell wall biosynthesis
LGSYAALLRARLSHRTFFVSIPDPLVFSLPLLACLRLTGARIAYVVHDPLPHAWRLPAPLRWIERAGFAAMYKLANALVVLTPSARDALQSAFHLQGKPIHVVPHGLFDVAEPPPPPGEGRLLLFGSLRRNKGVREAIEGVIAARARGAQVSLIIAGAANGEEAAYWRACRALAEAHPEAIDVREGFVSNTDLPALIGEIDAFLLPYREFNSESGVAILSVGTARPIIACPEGGISAILKDGAAGIEIAAPYDAAAVADAVAAYAGADQDQLRAQARAYQAVTKAARDWTAIGAVLVQLTSGLHGAKPQRSVEG